MIMAAQSGMGKTSATEVFVKEYLRIVDRVHLISGSLHIDPAYKRMKAAVTEKYRRDGINIDDPEENPFHEDLPGLRPSWQATLRCIEVIGRLHMP